MRTKPLRLLLFGYGFGLVLGIGLLGSGAGTWSAVLGFWLGGAVSVLGLGLVSDAAPSASATGPNTLRDADWLARENELRLWDIDLIEDLEEQAVEDRRSLRSGRSGNG